MGKVRCSYFCMQAVVQILRTYNPTQFQYRMCSHSFLNICKLQCRFYSSKDIKYHGEREVFIFLYVGCSTNSTYIKSYTVSVLLQYKFYVHIILYSFNTGCVHIHFLTFISCSAGFTVLKTLNIMGKVRCSYFCMEAVIQILRT